MASSGKSATASSYGMCASSVSSRRTSSRRSVSSFIPAFSPAVADALRPGREVSQLVLRLAREQIDQAALNALPLEQRVVDLLGDRHLDAVARREAECGVDGVGALGDAGQRRLELGPLAALRELHAEAMVAREVGAARRDDVADPREPRERQWVRAGGDPEARHLGETAGD